MRLRDLVLRQALVLLPATALLCGLALVGGCSGSQDETIGTGEVSLVFTNEGDTPSPMVVRWPAGDRIVTERFTVRAGGRVTLRAPRRLNYNIQMSPTCARAAEVPGEPVATPQDEVIDATRR
jgi:hypothetical protein